MNKINLYDSVISPLVTEKSTNLSEMNKVVFKVNRSANKSSVKKSIEKIFKVNVVKINIINKIWLMNRLLYIIAQEDKRVENIVTEIIKEVIFVSFINEDTK